MHESKNETNEKKREHNNNSNSGSDGDGIRRRHVNAKVRLCFDLMVFSTSKDDRIIVATVATMRVCIVIAWSIVCALVCVLCYAMAYHSSASSRTAAKVYLYSPLNFTCLSDCVRLCMSTSVWSALNMPYSTLCHSHTHTPTYTIKHLQTFRCLCRLDHTEVYCGNSIPFRVNFYRCCSLARNWFHGLVFMKNLGSQVFGGSIAVAVKNTWKLWEHLLLQQQKMSKNQKNRFLAKEMAPWPISKTQYCVSGVIGNKCQERGTQISLDRNWFLLKNVCDFLLEIE